MSIKKLLRNNIAQLLSLTGLTSPARSGRGRLSIATFHRVLTEAERQAYPLPGLCITPEELDALLAYFAEHFDCGTLATQHERYLSDEITTRPLLALTFDDAQHDNSFNARPLLAKHQVKASFFVPVEAVERQEPLWHDRLGFAILALLNQADSGREKLTRILDNTGLSANGTNGLVVSVIEASKKLALEARLSLIERLIDASGTAQVPAFARLMTFSEIAELVLDGHEIGSHSMTHCLMPECDDQALMHELAESKRILQSHLGQRIESFCYPNGNSDIRTAEAVARAGYLRAVTTTWGNNGRNGDQFQLRRYNMDARRVFDSNGKLMPAILAFRMSSFFPV